MKEALNLWAEDVSKAYDIWVFGHTERVAEILAKTRDAMRTHLQQKTLQALRDENERLGLYDPDKFCDANCAWSDHHPDCKFGVHK